MQLPRIAGCLLAAAIALAAPAAADWLVLDDGSRVETRGPWEVRGAVVVFTSPAGTLSSLRATEVDLDASERATEEALRPPEPPPPPPPKRKAKLVLTERDLPPVNVPVPAGDEEAAGESEAGETAGEGAPAATSPAGAGDSRLAVIGWDVATPDDFDGTLVSGRMRNVSDELLTRVALQVAVFNASGTLLTRQAADLETNGPVAPDRIVGFEARFDGLYDVTSVRFDTRGTAFLEGGSEGAEEATTGAGEAGADGTVGDETD